MKSSQTVELAPWAKQRNFMSALKRQVRKGGGGGGGDEMEEEAEEDEVVKEEQEVYAFSTDLSVWQTEATKQL